MSEQAALKEEIIASIPTYHVDYYDIDLTLLAIIVAVGMFGWIYVSVIRTIIKQNNKHHKDIINGILKSQSR